MKMVISDSIGERLLVRPVVAAGLLSVSRTMIYEMIARGTLPAVRVGDRAIRIPLSALKKFATVATGSGGDEAA